MRSLRSIGPNAGINQIPPAPLTQCRMQAHIEVLVNETGDYRFDVEGFGELKLYIDDQLVAANPGGLVPAPDEDSRLQVGRHSIRLEYFSQFPPSEFEVFWTPPNEPRATIPLERLSPKPETMFRVVE